MNLTVRRGKMKKPDRIVLAGTEGVGKTTFGASAPNPIFIAAEDGIAQFDVHSYPEPTCLSDVLECIRDLRTTDHDRKTLVIDTVDWIEPLVFKAVISRDKDWRNIEDPGYGKGYTMALDEWRKILADLDSLRAERGMEIILLAHTQTSNFNNPAGPDFSRYEMAMNKRGAALLKQWADTVMFACYEEAVVKDKGALRAKGQSTGARVMHTERRAAWDAKNRYNLPPVLPLSYDDYVAARDGNSAEVLSAQLDEAIAELNPDAAMKKKILAFVGNRTDPNKLAPALNRVRALIQEANQ